MKILIVEDELPVARQIAAALTEDGHDPKAVHSGEAALEELSKGPFDLIVVDVGLPGINGFELLQRLREQHLASRVLLLTGRSAVEDRVTGLQLGADDYLPKPFAMRELVARVRALHDSRQFELVGQLRRHILHAVHGQIDMPGRQSLLDLLGEHTLGSHLGQGHVGDLVAGSLDDFDFHSVPLLAKQRGHMVGLP